jgi:ornithine racemase
LSAPRVEIDLAKIDHNARVLVAACAARGISVAAVTKAMLGCPEVGAALMAAGVSSLADSRIENIERLRRGGLAVPVMLIRSPMLSQIDRVVASADVSCNTEYGVLEALSAAAVRLDRRHGVVLMVELGDLREGVLPECLIELAGRTLDLENLELRGIGTNLACQSGVVPDETNMAQLSALADSVEATYGIELKTVSGGNSANLLWLSRADDAGRVNELRLGESILLGRQPLTREPIDGLHLDAVSIVAEVIESKRKATTPTGRLGQTAFGQPRIRDEANSSVRRPWQSLLAVGRQDIDPDGLLAPEQLLIDGASSDHLVIRGEERLSIGSEIRFIPDYASLVRAMTSPFLPRFTRSGTPGMQ